MRNLNTVQMELGIGSPRAYAIRGRRPRQGTRASWWFNQMREIVDRAFDWQTAPPARPEQTWLVYRN